MKSLMRIVGICVVAAGLIFLVRGYKADTTVETEGGMLVHNVGLMEKQRNEMIVGGVLAGVGAAVFLAGEIGGGKSS